MGAFNEYLFDQEYILTRRFLRKLKARRQMIEASELNDKSFAQLKFLDECITTIESLKNNTDTVRTFYLKESARFVEVEIEMKKVKLNNNFLLKLLSKLIPKPKQD